MSVSIVASTDKFIAGLNSASTKLGKFVKSIGAAQTAVIGFGVYGFGAMISKALEAGSALHDFSQKANISTEAVSALDYAAKQLGGTTEGMHNALQFMSRTLGQAAQGSNSAAEAFSRLGLEWRELLNIPAEQQFLKIVDAINQLPTAAEKASAAQAIFGRGAKDLQGVIQAGTAEIIKMGDEAARTGQIIGSDQAAALDAASDAATSFKDSWSALWTQAVAVFAPVLSVVFFALEESLKAIRAAWYAVQYAIVGGIELIIRALQQLANAANYVLPSFAEFSMENFNANIDALAGQRAELSGKIQTIAGNGGGNPLSTVQLAPADVR